MTDFASPNRAYHLAGLAVCVLLTGCAGLERTGAPDSSPPEVPNRSQDAGTGTTPAAGTTAAIPDTTIAAPVAPAPAPPAHAAAAPPSPAVDPVSPPPIDAAPAPARPSGAPAKSAVPATAPLPPAPPQPLATAVRPSVAAAPAKPPAPAPAPEAKSAVAAVPTKPPVPAQAPRPATKATVAAVPAKPATPPLNLSSLESRLRETPAIGVFTKLSLKNQVDDLLEKFRAYHKRQAATPLAELRQCYNLLLLKVLSLLQDGDPALARDVVASREAIWGILSDPNKFAESKLMAGVTP